MSSPVAEFTTRRPSTLNALSFKKKEVIDISLNDHQDAYINSYTTLDRIEGTVSMKFDKDTLFDGLSIFFEGIVDQATFVYFQLD